MRLQVRGLTKAFYGVHALREIDFTVEPGELVGMIGPNGSGKTTAIDCISGFQKADAGEVHFGGQSVTGLPAHRLVKLGMVRTFQTVRVFPTLTVRQNIRAGALATAYSEGRNAVEQRVEALTDRFNLRRVADQPAGELSYGQRKLLELATGLVGRPQLLLLDEPVAAVNPTLAQTIIAEVLELHRSGVSVLLIEHNIEVVMNVCQRLVVLDHGEKVADGVPTEVINLPHVQEAYFGR
jgi:ABC-type branched-subunit amino acid transport system ATPase component